MIPENIEQFYKHNPEYARRRQRDCDIAEGLGLFEKVKLNNIKSEASGRTDILPLQYDCFYNRVGAAKDLAYVISPDARVPNYTTSLGDALEIAILKNIKHLPVTAIGGQGIQNMVDFIINEAKHG